MPFEIYDAEGRLIEWRIACETCHYGKSFGAARLNAQLAADRHHRKQRSHTVNVWNGDRLAEQRLPNLYQTDLLNPEEPPF